MKRILFDATTTNIADSTGVGIATLAYLHAVVAVKNQKLDVLIGEGDGYDNNAQYNVITVQKRSIFEKVKGLLCGHLHLGAVEILRRVKSGNYSLVCLNSGIVSGCLVKKIRSYGVDVIVLHHNYEPEYSKDSKSIFALWGYSTKFVELLEKKSYKYSSANLFLTEEDEILFEKHYGNRHGNYILGMFEPTPKEMPTIVEEYTKTIAISCSLNSIQNILNLRSVNPYFMEIYLKFPDWKIFLMGRNPNEEIMNYSLLYPNVEVYPNPKDIQSLCSSCAIYMCPMDRGGGLKLRLMDGLRNGMPVITHAVSARGYNKFSEKPYFCVYTDIEELLKKLKELIDRLNSGYINRHEIQQDYYEEFSFDAGVRRMKSVFSSLKLINE